MCRWAGHDFPINTALAVFGSFISYIYSAPPLKLKKEGWTGNYALGSSYIALPWWAGQALFGTLTPAVVVLTILYSTAGLGIAIVNDFKSIEGDREMGLQSLPVAFGIDKAKYICAATIDVTQLSVAAYLWLGLGKPIYAAVLLGLVLPQVRTAPPSPPPISRLFCCCPYPGQSPEQHFWTARCTEVCSVSPAGPPPAAHMHLPLQSPVRFVPTAPGRSAS